MKTPIHISSEEPSACVPLQSQVLGYNLYRRVERVDQAHVRLRLADESWEAPCRVDGDTVRVSIHRSRPLAAYARVPLPAYHAMLAMLGLLQWRALRRNPLLIPEDLRHDRQGCCLFSACGSFETLAHALDAPRICSGSRKFYASLTTHADVDALDTLLARMSESAAR